MVFSLHTMHCISSRCDVYHVAGYIRFIQVTTWFDVHKTLTKEKEHTPSDGCVRSSYMRAVVDDRCWKRSVYWLKNVWSWNSASPQTVLCSKSVKCPTGPGKKNPKKQKNLTAPWENAVSQRWNCRSNSMPLWLLCLFLSHPSVGLSVQWDQKTVQRKSLVCPHKIGEATSDDWSFWDWPTPHNSPSN